MTIAEQIEARIAAEQAALERRFYVEELEKAQAELEHAEAYLDEVRRACEERGYTVREAEFPEETTEAEPTEEPEPVAEAEDTVEQIDPNQPVV